MGSSRAKRERGEGSVNMMTARWLRGWALSDEWAVGKATYLQDRTVRLRQEDIYSYRTVQNKGKIKWKRVKLLNQI